MWACFLYFYFSEQVERIEIEDRECNWVTETRAVWKKENKNVSVEL